MTELKDYKVYTTINGGARGYHYEPNPNKDQSDIKLNDKQVYLKKDVDQVIAEKDKELRHHKYKRCLAMAERCGDAYDKWMMVNANAVALGKDGVGYYRQARWKVSHHMRWQKRWLELADHYKEKKQ